MSFYQSSINLRLENEVFLTADCKTVDGQWKTSSLNLNDCIENVNGELVFRAYGNFGHSCRDTTLDGSTLCCQAQTICGDWTDSRINLDEAIENIDGNLQFQG